VSRGCGEGGWGPTVSHTHVRAPWPPRCTLWPRHPASPPPPFTPRTLNPGPTPRHPHPGAVNTPHRRHLPAARGNRPLCLTGSWSRRRSFRQCRARLRGAGEVSVRRGSGGRGRGAGGHQGHKGTQDHVTRQGERRPPANEAAKQRARSAPAHLPPPPPCARTHTHTLGPRSQPIQYAVQR
jgi:hypothetical protein